jgi:hypothetical protein
MPSSTIGPASVKKETIMVGSPSSIFTSPQDSSFPQSPVADIGLSIAQMPVIPPEHPFRTLVLCFDGTGDQFDSDNSNIVQFFSMLPKRDRTKQMVYYQWVSFLSAFNFLTLI